MQGLSPPFAVGTRVRLKDGIDPALYGGLSCTGQEGVVVATGVDEFGYPAIRIEWDRDHWADNGQPNRVTWQDHFEVVSEPSFDRLVEQSLIDELARLRDQREEEIAENDVRNVSKEWKIV